MRWKEVIFADWKVTLGGFDPFSDFALVYPLVDEPYNLANSISFGDCSSSFYFHHLLERMASTNSPPQHEME